MTRPRASSDDELLARIADGLQVADSWTLADAARAAGVHSATLIKRFGSRLGVLEALSRRWVASVPTEPQDAGGVAELRAWIQAHTPEPGQPARALSGLGMLLEDLQHDTLSQLLREGWARERRYLAALVRDAVDRGETARAPDPDHAADLLLMLVHGAHLQAAAERGNPDPGDPRAPLTTLLEGWT